jgi:hypothetical protein
VDVPDFSGVAAAIEGAGAISTKMDQLSEAVAQVSESMSLHTEEQVRALTSVASTFPTAGIGPTVRFDLGDYAARLLVGVGSGLASEMKTHVQTLLDSRDQIRRQFAEMSQQLRSVLSSAATAAWQEALKIDWDAVRTRLESYAPDQQEALREALGIAGLLPAPTMPTELGRRVVWLHQNRSGGSQIANAVSGMYSRQSWRLLDDVHHDWSTSQILGPHKRTLADATVAMRQGLYTLVAPALVPLVEGIAAEYLSNHEGRRVKVKHSQVATKLEDAIPFWAANAVGLGAVMAFLEFLEERLFGYVDFEKNASEAKRMSVLNRHVILHGRSPGHATRMNGLRSFLLLDTLGAVVLVIENR